MYRLDNRNLGNPPSVAIVGCGGTGGYVAESLCRLFTGREVEITLVDHDRVEHHNLLRQNFYAGDVGEFKAKALAMRLARQYGRVIGYSVYPVQKVGMSASILIGCVDNPQARRTLAAKVQRGWLIDAGNGETWGQVLVGNARTKTELEGSFLEDDGICVALPVPTVQMPELLRQVPEQRPDLDCAAALDLTDQDPTINQVMASLVLQVVRRLVAGTCPFMALYLDLKEGKVSPVYAEPETVAQMTKVPKKRLMAPKCARCNGYHGRHEYSGHNLVPVREQTDGQ